METLQTAPPARASSAATAPRLPGIGLHIARWGVALALGWIGLFKFTGTEANAILPLLNSTPLLRWMPQLLGIREASGLIGTVEIVTACLLVLGTWWPVALRWGSWLGVGTFLNTLSFLFLAPNMLMKFDDFWIADGFVLKDIVLLGVCLTGLFPHDE
jgi:reactive chlorine resistance protein C